MRDGATNPSHKRVNREASESFGSSRYDCDMNSNSFPSYRYWEDPTLHVRMSIHNLMSFERIVNEFRASYGLGPLPSRLKEVKRCHSCGQALKDFGGML